MDFEDDELLEQILKPKSDMSLLNRKKISRYEMDELFGSIGN